MISQENVELSFINTVRTVLHDAFALLGMCASSQIFRKAPDIRVADVILPVVVIGSNGKISVPAGLGNIGSQGKRQSKRVISLNVGSVAKTSAMAKGLDEQLLNYFENCVFIPIYRFAKDIRGPQVGNARVNIKKVDFVSDSDSPLVGNDFAISIYLLSYYVDL